MSISAIAPGELRTGGFMDKRKMKDIPADDRPYEKCVRMGPEALSDEELLSIIIRTGSRGQNSLETARQILELSYPEDGILGLSHLSLQDLTGVEGIGTVKGIQLLCIGELSRRISKRFAISRIREMANRLLIRLESSPMQSSWIPLTVPMPSTPVRSCRDRWLRPRMPSSG